MRVKYRFPQRNYAVGLRVVGNIDSNVEVELRGGVKREEPRIKRELGRREKRKKWV